MQYQQTPYCLSPVTEIQFYLLQQVNERNISDCVLIFISQDELKFSEEELYAISLRLEERQKS